MNLKAFINILQKTRRLAKVFIFKLCLWYPQAQLLVIHINSCCHLFQHGIGAYEAHGVFMAWVELSCLLSQFDPILLGDCLLGEIHPIALRTWEAAALK